MQLEKNKTACFSGHREIKDNIYKEVYSRIMYELNKCILKGYENFICGGALGFDTMAAQAVLSLKEKNPQIKLYLFLPGKNQTEGWKQGDADIYNSIINSAEEVIYISENCVKGSMLARNRAMVDKSNLLIAYCKSVSGGTVYTYNYAVNSGIERVNLASIKIRE